MRPIYKSLALAATTLQVSLVLNAETRDDESASTMALQAELLDSLRVELVAQNVSGARNLIESGECIIDGSNLTITLDASEWTRGAMYRVQVLATFGTQTQVIYALDVMVPYYVALSEGPQEFSDNVTIVSTITDVTEADLEGLALEATSQEIKAAIIPISQAAEAYNVGKTELAAAITAKGVETSATESYPQMAEKVTQIVQTQQVIDGGEMYAKQLFGSLTTPNYWNLYDVLAQLLSDGRLVQYGGILLAEYYRGYDSLALSGAGAGGAYVVSDLDENGQFKMYTEDTTHIWATEFDGKGNRWVAYCFADAGHNFTITDTNISPRSIHIGRHVGNITSVVNGRVCEIVVTDGNTLGSFYNTGYFTQNFGRDVVLKMSSNPAGCIIYNNSAVEKFYCTADEIKNAIVDNCSNLSSAIVKCNKIDRETYYDITFSNCPSLKTYILECPYINKSALTPGMVNVFLKTEHCNFLGVIGAHNAIKYIYIGYFTNDRTQLVSFMNYGSIQNPPTDLELQDGWCKPLNISIFTDLTEENIVNHILNKLGDNTGQSPLTITLGATNLAKLTEEEIAIATNKGFTLA